MRVQLGQPRSSTDRPFRMLAIEDGTDKHQKSTCPHNNEEVSQDNAAVAVGRRAHHGYRRGG